MSLSTSKHSAVNHSVLMFPLAANDYGLFLSDDDPKKGIWLEAGKALDYYMLRNGVSNFSTHIPLNATYM